MVKLVVPLMLVSAVALAEPRLEIQSLELGGRLDTPRLVEIDRVVKTKYADLLGCYSDALAKTPSLGGEITIVLVIKPDGKVSGAGVSGFDVGVDACLKRVLKQLAFAPFTEKSEVHYGWLATTMTTGGAFASLTGTGDISSGFDDANIYGGLLGSGSGGGGTGWGTIGTGRYGTIGHGSGAGGGGMRGRTAAVPTISIGQATISGKGQLDKAIVRRYIKRNIQKLQYCYEKELLSHPKLAGTVTATFTIGASGVVAAGASASGFAEVEPCIAQVIQDIQFPKPKGDAPVDVKFPFSFRPSGS